MAVRERERVGMGVGEGNRLQAVHAKLSRLQQQNRVIHLHQCVSVSLSVRVCVFHSASLAIR